MQNIIQIIDRKMRLRAYIYMAVVAMATLLPSCNDKEPPFTPDDPNTLTLLLNVPGTDEPKAATKATSGDKKVEDLAIWLFDAGGICADYRYVTPSAADQVKWNSGAFQVTLKGVPDLTGIKSMHIVANADNLETGASDADAQIGKRVHEISGAITTLKVTSTIAPITAPLPMSYISLTPVTAKHNVVLTRAVARIKVDVSVLEDYVQGLKSKIKLQDAKVFVGNLTAQGSAGVDYPTNATTPVASDCEKYGNPANVTFYNTLVTPLTYNSSGDKSATAEPIYLYQRGTATYNAEHSDRYTTITLQVPYSNDGGATWDDNNFYKVKVYNTDLVGKAGQYHILPNRSYNVHLTIVNVGEDGIRVEIDCEKWNVEEKELATSSLNLSNTKFEGYADPETEMTVVRVAAFGKTGGKVEGSPGVTVTSGEIFPAYSPGGTDIKVKMAGTTGTITLKQDGTERIVDLKRYDQRLVWDEQIKMVAGAGKSAYSTVKCIKGEGFKISKDDDKTFGNAEEMVEGKEFYDIGSGFYLYTTSGFSLTAPPAVTSASVLITDVDDVITRVFVEREAATSTPLSNFYVGTFHRSKETGERLIRQHAAPNKPLYGGKWKAKVVSGDWIVLDPNGVKSLPASGTPEDDQPKDATATKTTYIDNKTGNIEFRLGLTEKNKSGAETEAPRYGLVLVMHEVSGARKYHPILVRQGEAAAAITGAGPAKWDVYNVGYQGDVIDVSRVNYPSQVGGMYYYGKKHPHYTAYSEVNTTPQGYPAGLSQPPYTFPAGTGYRAPTMSECKLLVDNLYIKTGYLADGFFDRATIQDYLNYSTFEPNPLQTRSSAVSPTTADIAFIGGLVYNPTTYESIFIPYAGARLYFNPITGRSMAWGGFQGAYQTSTVSVDNTSFNVFILGTGIGTEPRPNDWIDEWMYIGSAGSGDSMTLRCVKD